MTHSMKRFSFQLIASGMAMASMLAPLQAQAFLGDDEARRAIIELRQRFEASEARQAKLAEEARSQGNIGQRSLLDLANQIEQLRSEVANLRGQNEQLAREVSELQRKQNDVQTGLEERLRQVEPSTITLEGGNVTFACPGRFTVKASENPFLGEASGAAEPDVLPSGFAGETPNWIDLELRGWETETLPGVKYTIEFADGSKRKGTLDSNGYAHIENVPKTGQHKVVYENEGEDPPAYDFKDLAHSIRAFLGE